MTNDSRVRTRQLADGFGLEVLGLELHRPQDRDTVDQLRALFDGHHLLLFRGQTVSGEKQLEVCRWFRPVVDPTAWISNVEPGFHPEGALLFHCDYAFTPHPMLGLSLHALEISEGSAPTRFASNVCALATLSHTVRSQVQHLNVVHMIDSVHGRDNIRTRVSDVEGDPPFEIYPRCAASDLAAPVLGVPLLFVLEQQASHFEGWSCAQSDELLDELFAHLYTSENIYEHEWQEGDLIVWDNLALQHGRRANPNTVRRSLRRVTMNDVTTADLIKGTGFDPLWRQTNAAK